MTVGELAAKLNLKTFNESDFDREITCGYCGDLLSWVMGRAKEGCVWFTVMNNINIAAVALLADAACIVIAEGSIPDEAVKKAAEDNDINILTSDLPVYELAVECSKLI